MKERYGITLKRVPADAAVFVNKLLAEKQAGAGKGTMDLLWINGENFKNARENDLLYGPVTADSAQFCPGRSRLGRVRFRLPGAGL